MLHFQTKPFTIGTWMVLKLPTDVSVQLPSRGQVMVKGTINGYAFQTPLEPDGTGSHWFRLDDRLQQATGAKDGAVATLAIEATKEWPEPEVPKELQAALHSNPEARELWTRITPMARWEWLRWINSTKQPETWNRHIEVACSKLAAGERRPCCFNRNMCCVQEVSKNGILLKPAKTR